MYARVVASLDDFDPDRTVNHTHEGSIGNLCTAEIRAKMERVLEAFPFGEVGRKVEELLR